MIKSKKVFASVISTACLVGLFPVSSFAATNGNSVESNETANVQVLSNTISDDNTTRETQIVVDGVKHMVKVNFVDGTVKVDGAIQEGLKATWDESKASESINKNSRGLDVIQRSAGSGYKYMGTISGHTKTVKGSAAIAQLALTLFPGVNIPVKLVVGALNIYVNLELPMAYYSYDLYEKNPLTNDWYQYAVVKFYEDEAHTKKVGTTITGSPFKVYLPNS
ncbi:MULTISPECIES: hypothetical protein [Bacillus cereus group]|uniref:SPBc2 prophage-derived uncharacterized protein yomL n=1 Tax=Bacillus thuringiensis TaxID=1428 RepID=A0A1C4E977_BACTU|nr:MULTISPECIES: hypothetical protein [Bacillus cereus group]MED3025073.1 hypothetical protein [Bacillus wiedmannii]OTY00539.1 hypothetical protein BK729_09850 [Bacillus thuringiensis serovar wratislaviensis]OUB61904.1 hypothetical protein BK743_07190 [Bacillus thuringiensis serovar sylvestriensis]SCC40203.1 SPBc2 prophage-derived uncharacterized protein yomL [Bacillus thuringiensis]